MRATPDPATLDWLEAPVPDGHLGQAALLRLLGDEGAPAEADHLARCAACRARADGLAAHRDAFRAQHPPAAFMAQLAARRAAQRPWWRRPVALAAGIGLLAAAAAVIIAVQAPVAPAPSGHGAASGTRIKGGVGLSFHVRSADGVRDGAPGAVLHPGDAIQLRYSTPAHRHLVVVSLDSRGAVTPFYEAGGHSLAIEPGSGQLLAGSVVLDDALGPERVVGCFSDAPLNTAAVLAAGRDALAASGGDPTQVSRLPLDCAQTAFTIVKQPR